MRLFTTGVLSLLMAFAVLYSQNSYAQSNTITSSYGWTATITIVPTNVVVSTTNCQWYYHYGVNYTVTVTFSGSASNRGLNFNTYLSCSGGSGNEPYASSHYYSANQSENRTTGPNHRQYNAISSYSYGSSPSCTTITLADANCTAVRLEYWGNGVSNGSVTFPINPVSSPLPIKLIYFNPEAKDNQVELSWSTESERNNDYFTVEKTTDGINYEFVEQVKGAGNSTTQKNYSCTDYAPYKGISYYRLTQTDFNGMQESFDLKSVEINAEIITNVYPNPAVDSKVNLVISESGTVTMNLYNVFGQLVKTQSILSHSGNVTEQVELPETGNALFIELIQDNAVIGRHKVLTTRP